MKEMYQKLLAVKEAREEDLLKLDGVHGVAIGYKEQGGENTGELCIVILTEEKKTRGLLPEGQFIPQSYDGVPTDVVQTPPLKPIPVKSESIELQDDKRYRPVPGGARIVTEFAPGQFGAGSLGLFARSKKKEDSPSDVYILTNAHCLPVIGGAVLQGGERIAAATRVVRSERVDGGIAKMDDPAKADLLNILEIGRPMGAHKIGPEDLGKRAIKRGSTTELTRGVIQYIDLYANEKRGQIGIAGKRFSDHGDSGSAVLLDDGTLHNQVLGLLWGGNGELTAASPIQDIMRELDIQIYARPFGLSYRVHVKNNGWLAYVNEGQSAGTTGQSRRLEAVQIKLADCTISGARVKYRVHVKEKGWLPYTYDDGAAGTTGESRRAEAIQIELEGLPGYSVLYRVHMHEKGWGPWARDGQTAGTTGESRRIEALQVIIVEK